MDINALISNFRIVVIERFAKFEGRAGKREFWYFVLVNVVVSILISLLRSDVLSYAYSLAILVPSLAVGVRRLHDINKSGWLMAIVVIPVIGIIILLVLAAQDGTPGANQYGDNPEPKQGHGNQGMSEPIPPAEPVQPMAPSEPSAPEQPAGDTGESSPTQ